MTKFFARWPSGRAVVFRSLSWAEYRQFERKFQYLPPGQVYLEIYRAVVLEGPAERDLTAGIVDFVGRTLLHANPFNGQHADIRRAVDLKRQELRSDYLLSARAVIASLFTIPIAEIDTWDAEQFFEYVAMAEFVSGRKLDPADPTAKPQPGAAHPKRPLTPRQQVVLEQVHRRDQPPAPAKPPAPQTDDPAPRLRRPLTSAQQMVVDRVRRTQPR